MSADTSTETIAQPKGTDIIPAEQHDKKQLGSAEPTSPSRLARLLPRHGTPPLGLRWRSSTWFIAFTCAIALLVDLSSYSLIVPVIPYRLEELGYSDIGSKTGWLVAAYSAGLIVSSPPISYLGEKIKNRRWPLVFALLFMVLAIILFMLIDSFAGMIVARILQGISGTAIWTLGLALVRDSVPESRFGATMGWVMTGFSLGSVLGPLLGGILYDKLGWEAPFVFAIVLVSIDMALRLIMIEKKDALVWIQRGVEVPNFEAYNYENGKVIEKEDTKKNAWKGLVHLTTSSRPITLLLLTLLQGLAIGGLIESQMTLWLAHRYNFDSLQAGLVFIAVVVPTFIASPLAGWVADKHGAKWITSGGILLSIPCYLLLIISGPLPLFVFFLVLLGTSLSLFLTPTTQDLSQVVEICPSLGPAHVYGAFNMAYSVGAFVGPIIGGQLVDALEIRKAWIAMTSILAGLATIMLVPSVLFVGGSVTSTRVWKRVTGRHTGAGAEVDESGVSKTETVQGKAVDDEARS